jgi:hypothetical protein
VATKLEGLLIKEISGVDDPANEAPGWMVAKSGTTGDVLPEGGIVIHQHFNTDTTNVVDVEAPAPAEAEALSVVGKIKALLTGKEDIDKTKEELAIELDSRFADLSETLKSLVPASIEAPAEVAEVAPEIAAVPEVAGVSAEDVAKAIEDGLAPFLEVIDKTLDRIAGIESALVIRKGLDGQESRDESADTTPTLNDAFALALKGAKVELS